MARFKESTSRLTAFASLDGVAWAFAISALKSARPAATTMAIRFMGLLRMGDYDTGLLIDELTEPRGVRPTRLEPLTAPHGDSVMPMTRRLDPNDAIDVHHDRAIDAHETLGVDPRLERRHRRSDEMRSAIHAQRDVV